MVLALYLVVQVNISCRQHYLAAFRVFLVHLEWTLNAAKEQMIYHFPEKASKFPFTRTKLYIQSRNIILGAEKPRF